MDALHRMLDANLNRAREGLRVLEDTARFALDSEALSRELRKIGATMTAEWVKQAGPEGQAIVDAYAK